MRSILTLIGVVMGVASVIMVITLVNGANKYVSTKLSGYGADVFTVTRMSSVIFTADDYFRYQKRKIVRIEDYEAIRDNCENCSETGALLSKSTNVVANGHSSNNTEIRGYTWTMLQLNNIDIALGRGFTPADDDHGTHDAIIGYDIVDNLMPDGDPIGKELRVDGIPYTIVGVGERQGKTLGQSQDNWVAIPISTYQQTYGYNDSVDIYARANGNAEVMERAKDEVRVLMRSRRHNAPGTPDDFELETNDTFLDIWKQISGLFTWIVLGIASISLVVGGIVIMNIMLVSVTERTREIGVRKALGARQRDVLLQFLIESATMALVGGAIGVLFGVLVAKLITVVIGFPTNVQLWSVMLGLSMATITGIFFGVYPASKAAKLDPVTALRAEL
jgi:putative ABC transport system permease protein